MVINHVAELFVGLFMQRTHTGGVHPNECQPSVREEKARPTKLKATSYFPVTTKRNTSTSYLKYVL